MSRAERIDAARQAWWFPLAGAVVIVVTLAMSAMFPWGFA